MQVTLHKMPSKLNTNEFRPQNAKCFPGLELDSCNKKYIGK